MDNRTIEEVRDNETKLINEIIDLEKQNKKYKEVLDKIKEYIKQCDWHNDDVYIGEDILELLEETE